MYFCLFFVWLDNHRRSNISFALLGMLQKLTMSVSLFVSFLRFPYLLVTSSVLLVTFSSLLVTSFGMLVTFSPLLVTLS